MELIKGGIAHIPFIRKVVDETWPHAYGAILSKAQIGYMIGHFYSDEALKNQFESGHEFFLISAGNKALGFAGFELNYEADTAKLHKLYVLPEAQRKGLGIVLLKAVERAAIAAKQQAILLNVNRYNKAFRFYKKHGFEVLREEDIDIGDGYFMNDYVMGKALPGVIPAV